MITTDYKFIEVENLASQIEASSEKVAFKAIITAGGGAISLLAFEAGQKLATHLAPAEVMVYVLSGEVKFTLPEEQKTLREGDFMLIGRDVAHSVDALKDSKLMLVKLEA